MKSRTQKAESRKARSPERSAEFRLAEANAKADQIHEPSPAYAGGAFEAAAYFTRGGTGPTPGHDATERERRARVAAEQARLVRWAEENGKLGGPLPPNDSSGSEHLVAFDAATRRYFKATRIESHQGYGIALGSYLHGATPAEYLDRMALQNRLFSDDIRLERITLAGGKPVIITSQPAVAGTAATQAAIDELMAEKGFERLATGAYYHAGEGLLAFDLKPRNVVQGADGRLYPIDPVVQRIDEDFATFLRANPTRINYR